MRFFTPALSLLLWLGLWLGSISSAWATHVQGGQLTYLNVGTNQYVVTLLDALGRTVRTASIAAPNVGTSYSLDLSALPAGGCALCVSTPGGVDVHRVVQQ